MSYAVHIGPVPADGHVLHTCDRGLCIEPGHLFLGDAHTNMVDMWHKGRHPAPQTRLTAAQLERIVGAEDARELAQEFGMHYSYIYKLRRRLRAGGGQR